MEENFLKRLNVGVGGLNFVRKISQRPATMWTYYNGQFFPDHSVPVAAADLGWRYGVSLFETMRFTGGRVPLLPEHFRRLLAAMQLLDMEIPASLSLDFLLSEIQRTVKKNGVVGDARVRLQVSAQKAPDFPEKGYPMGLKIEVYSCNRLIFNEEGLGIGLASGNFQPLPLPYAQFKTGSYLPYFMASQEARQGGLTDVLMRNSTGRIGEATTANVFWVRNGQLHTPPLTEPIVSGVARSRLLNVLSQKNSPVQETLLTLAELWNADSLFLTNAFYGLRWVASCEGKWYEAGMAEALFKAAFADLTS